MVFGKQNRYVITILYLDEWKFVFIMILHCHNFSVSLNIEKIFYFLVNIFDEFLAYEDQDQHYLAD